MVINKEFDTIIPPPLIIAVFESIIDFSIVTFFEFEIYIIIKKKKIIIIK